MFQTADFQAVMSLLFVYLLMASSADVMLSLFTLFHNIYIETFDNYDI